MKFIVVLLAMCIAAAFAYPADDSVQILRSESEHHDNSYKFA